MSEPRMTIKEMMHLCFLYSGMQASQVQIIAHEVRPGVYFWDELDFIPSEFEQMAVLPAPTESLLGTVYQYTGTSTSKYKNGCYYVCAVSLDRYEYIDFYNLLEKYPRPRHRIRKFMNTWKMLY